MSSIRSNNLSLRYKRLKPSGCKDRLKRMSLGFKASLFFKLKYQRSSTSGCKDIWSIANLEWVQFLCFQFGYIFSCWLYYLNISLISTVSSRYLNLYILPEPALNIRYIYFKFVPAIQLYNQNFPTFFNEIL